MRIYGAGSLEDIKKCVELGVVGILTNPEGFDRYNKGEMTLEEITKAIVDLTDLPVYIQIHGKTADQLVEKAQRLNAISPNRWGLKLFRMKKVFGQSATFKSWA